MSKRVLSLALAIVVLALSCTPVSEIPANEIRAEGLNKIIMCPICPGESIDQASNDLSIQMRGIVREQVAEGLTDDEIKQFWIERYGPSVVLEPPKEGFGFVAWVLPPVGIALALFALYLTLRWMKREPAAQTRDVVQETRSSTNEHSYYIQRIEAALNTDEPVVHQKGEEEFSQSGAEGAR